MGVGAAQVVIKIGGSTLGAHDTTLADVAALQRRGEQPIVVHGGGPAINRWLDRLALPVQFVDGLRVTDGPALEVVVGVLRGLVNAQLVAELTAAGARAIGLCGADGGLLAAQIERPALGFVGEVRRVDSSVIAAVIAAGFVPVIAPIAVGKQSGTVQLLNVNADTVAGQIAAALPGARLVFLTDVAGVLDSDGNLIERLDGDRCAMLRRQGVLSGGMIPKIDACLATLAAGGRPLIVDGRQPHALLGAVDGAAIGTRFA